MKTLYDISWQVSEPEYRADPALSYSTLSKYEREGRFNSLPTLFDRIETPSLTFGSMVDTLITGSEEEFKQQFIVIDDPGLTDSLKEITQILYSLHKEDGKRFEDIEDEELARIGKECNYYAGDRYASYRVKQIKENCKPYYNTLSLKTCERTAFYFADNDPFDTTIQRFYQLKFKHSFEGVDYRCMMDLAVVDNEKKTVQPTDLKTSSHNEWEFPKSFQQWRYRN